MKIKVTSILLILMLIITNFSFAVEFSKDDFKKSAIEIFPKEILIKTESGESRFDIPGNVSVNDSVITIENDDVKSYINYLIEGNKITFTSQHALEIEFDENGEMTSDSATIILAHIFLYTDYMYREFYTAVDLLNIDYDVATTYMQQVANAAEEVEEDTGNEKILKSKETTDLYTYEMEYNLIDKYSKFIYTINLDEVAKIDESLLTDGVTYNVSFSDVSTRDESNNNTVTNENTNVENTNTNTNQNTNSNTNTQTEMPKTGIRYETVYFLIGVIALCFVLGYKVYKAK